MHFDAFLKSFEHLGDSFYVWIVKWSMLYEIDIVESKNPFFLYSKGTACDDITYESESGE